jgi:hypothetical protein
MPKISKNAKQPASVQLDGMTIVRFVRGYASGAGLEYDVAMINESLCARHAIRVIQIHMARKGDPLEPRTVSLGRGSLTTIPLLRDVLPVDLPATPSAPMALVEGLKRTFRDRCLFNPATGDWYARWAGSKRPHLRPGDVPGVGEVVREVIQQLHANIVVVHAAGGSDAWEAIHEARQAGVPAALQLHFSNRRFKDHSVRLQVAQVQGVGGVSGVDVPPFLKPRFTNLLTAIDLEFFRRESAQAWPQTFSRPVLVLPARIVPTKGHGDLVDAVYLLRQRGISVDVALAGRADQVDYEVSLRRRISEKGLENSFHFLGMLSPRQVRDLFGSSSVLAFPTHHAEGLPRILLEAQAMQVPVVVYDTGGSRAGLQAGSTGLLVRTGDIAGFADALARILQSSDIARAYGSAGRTFVETDFTPEALADRHEEFIRRTLMSASDSRHSALVPSYP